MTRTEILGKLERKRRNMEWLRNNVPALKERFAERYVAVSDGEVKASAKDLATLFRRLRKRFDQEEISTFAVDLITEEDVIWIR